MELEIYCGLAFLAGLGASVSGLCATGLMADLLRPKPRTEAYVVYRHQADDVLRLNPQLVAAQQLEKMLDAMGESGTRLRRQFDATVAWIALREDGTVPLFRVPR